MIGMAGTLASVMLLALVQFHPAAAQMTEVQALDEELEEIEASIPELERYSGRVLPKATLKEIEKGLRREQGLTIKSLPPGSREGYKQLLRRKSEKPAIEQLHELAKGLMERSESGTDIEREKKFFLELSSQIQIEIFQVIEDNLPGLPVLGGTGPITQSELFECTSDAANWHQSLRSTLATRKSEVLTAGQSVGRIVEKHPVDGKIVTHGTGFVVDVGGDTMIATACHVANRFAIRDPGSPQQASLALGPGQQPRRVFVEFGDLQFGENEELTAPGAFPITGVRFMPQSDGCDAALLRVENPQSRLPVPLSFTPNPLGPDERPRLVTIGYPEDASDDGDKTDEQIRTDKYFDCARSGSPTNVAKFAFGGAGLGLVDRQEYKEVKHSTPTTGGQSGSPILTLPAAGPIEVVGIHVCCRWTLAQDSEEVDPCQNRLAGTYQAAIAIHDVVSLFQNQ